MGRGRKAPQEADRTDVSGSEGALDTQANEQVQQRGIVGAAVSTIRHFFGAFSPLCSLKSSIAVTRKRSSIHWPAWPLPAC